MNERKYGKTLEGGVEHIAMISPKRSWRKGGGNCLIILPKYKPVQ